MSRRTIQNYSLYLSFNRSPQQEDYFITSQPSSQFIYQSSYMWNSCRQTSSKISFNTPTNGFKNILKYALQELQFKHDTLDWCELNFATNELKFWFGLMCVTKKNHLSLLHEYNNCTPTKNITQSTFHTLLHRWYIYTQSN